MKTKQIEWIENLESGLSKASQDRKLVLLDFFKPT
jgi:hypothetical protein